MNVLSLGCMQELKLLGKKIIARRIRIRPSFRSSVCNHVLFVFKSLYVHVHDIVSTLVYMA